MPAAEPVASSTAPVDNSDRSPLSPAARAVLESHNEARAEHCAPPLEWDQTLAATAAAWGQELAARGCPLAHSESPYGENLYMATAGATAPAEAVRAWVDERQHYRFARGGFSMRTGHFTQVVWAGTTRVGCATRVCNGMDLWVCNYDPPGNVQGGYADNVAPISCAR